MKTRIILGFCMIVLLAGLFWLDYTLGSGTVMSVIPLRGLVLTLLTIALSIIAFGEIARIVERSGVEMLRSSGLGGTVLISTMPYWYQFVRPDLAPAQNLMAMLGLVTLAIFIEQMIRNRTDSAVARISCTLLAVMYLGIGAAMMITLRIGWGVQMLLTFLIAVKFTDIGAYFTGKMIGKHKLIPWLSPGKTWEGLFGGLIAAAGVTMLITWVFQIHALQGWKGALFGVIVGIAGQAGDLCESLLKRSTNIKDSGSMVPEFGGVLDMLDSPLLAAPVGYLAMTILFLA